MRDHNNIMEMASLGPQYLGFVLYPASPRFVGSEFTVPASLSASIKKVGVFVNEFTDLTITKATSLGLDFVQLHGDETADQCRKLNDSGLRIIKAFALDDEFDFNKTRSFKNVVDYFLFDTKGKLYGGNASAFNWNVLNRYDQEVPFFLSGGLSPANIGQLGDVAKMNIHALDFNSGVEEAPGLKSLEKVRAALKHLST